MNNTYRVSDANLEFLLNNPLFKQILDTLSTGISIISNDGRILYFNDSEYTIFGFDKTKNYIGNKLDTLFSSTKSMDKALNTKQKNAHPTISHDGVEGITNRLPILGTSGELVCCIVETITTTLEKKRIDDLLQTIQLLRQKAHFDQRSISQQYGMHTFESIIGESNALQKMKSIGKRFAKGAEPVVIMGESGTGKELVAQALHMDSPRADKPFVAVNCAALPPDLVESELFGYASGAFTGSKQGGMKGKFELADKGSIFLDEIGELPFSVQAKLLRVLESKEIQKIGNATPVYSDFRLIAATNQNLGSLVANNTFREDLYHRLNTLELFIPPLRERHGDIPLLISFILHQIAGQHRAENLHVAKNVLQLFNTYTWSGNIRELKNVLTYAMCCMEDHETRIETKHLPPRLLNRSRQAKTDPAPHAAVSALGEASKQAQKQALVAALQQSPNKTRVASMLGISRSKLYKLLREFDL